MKTTSRLLLAAGLVAASLTAASPAQLTYGLPTYDPVADYQRMMAVYQQQAQIQQQQWMAHLQQMQAQRQQMMQQYLAQQPNLSAMPATTISPATQQANFQALQQSIAGSQSAFDDYMSSVQSASAARDDAATDFSNQVILNQQDYTDSSTGETYTLDNLHNYQWVDTQGNTTGTDTYTPPDYTSGWTALDPVE